MLSVSTASKPRGVASSSSSAVAVNHNHQHSLSSTAIPSKPDQKPLPLHAKPFAADMIDPSSSSSSTGIMRIDGSEEDLALSNSEYLTRPELLQRRSRRAKQLSRIYRDHYWALMEELKIKCREYWWEYGKSPFQEDEDGKINWNQDNVTGSGNWNGNPGLSNEHNMVSRCEFRGCKVKAMALTKFCHLHILSDANQKLYTDCKFVTKSSSPTLCRKPLLRSTIPSYCPLHYEKAENNVARALKKAGLNVSSTSKFAPKFHVVVAEFVRQIQSKRSAQKVKKENI